MWKGSIENMEKYFEVCHSVRMDVTVTYDTDFEIAHRSEFKLLLQLQRKRPP